LKWNRRTAKSDANGATRIEEYWRQRQRKQQEAGMVEPKETASGPSYAKAADGVPAPPAAAVPPEPTLAQNCVQLPGATMKSGTFRPWWWKRFMKTGWSKPPKKCYR
jgi:hypothetical protein